MKRCPASTHSHGPLRLLDVRKRILATNAVVDPEGARKGIGALLVGYYDNERRLVFTGKVGTGWSNAQALELRQHVEPLLRETSPFEVNGPDRPLQRRAHWLVPRLVCEVMFTEWTHEGTLRHPSFQGLRRDKKPTQVRRESTPADQPLATRAPATVPASSMRPRRQPRSSDAPASAGLRRRR
jgi:bifunctional non-homologous end joining protein LigD